MKHIRKVAKPLLALIIVAVALVCSTVPAYADDTTNYPWIRPDNWLSQVIAKPSGGTGSGHMVVDIQLEKSGQTYNPCHNSSDTHYNGCDVANGGIYKVQRYTPTTSDFPFGIFIDNSNNGVNHFWARRVGAVFMELYPYSVAAPPPLNGYRLDPGACNCTVTGGYSVVVNDWKGGYSANIGTIRTTSLSDSDVGRMNGFIKRNGSTVKQGDVNIDWFGQDKNFNRSSTGYPVISFASWPTNNDGYYTSGPVLKGNYHIFVLDKGPNQLGPNRKVECYGIGVQGLSDRLDIELTSPHFGLDGPGRQCYDRAA